MIKFDGLGKVCIFSVSSIYFWGKYVLIQISYDAERWWYNFIVSYWWKGTVLSNLVFGGGMNTRSALSAFPRQKYNTLHDVIWWLKSPQPSYNEKKGLLRAKLAKIEQNCLVNKKAFYNSASKTSFRRHLPLYYQNKKEPQQQSLYYFIYIAQDHSKMSSLWGQ